jgi:hypothetical protein
MATSLHRPFHQSSEPARIRSSHLALLPVTSQQHLALGNAAARVITRWFAWSCPRSTAAFSRD